MTLDLWLMFSSLLLFCVGFGLYFFSWPLFVLKLGATAVDLGYLTALGSLIAALSVIPGGWLADKYDRRWQLIVGWAMCIPVPLFYLAARGWHQLWPGVVLFNLSVFNLPAMSAYTVAKARTGKVSSALTIVYSGFSIGFVVGPLLAVAVIDAWGMNGVFWGAALLYAVSTILILFISPDRPAGADHVHHRGLGVVLPSRELFRTCVTFAGVAAALYFSNSFVAPYARDVWGRSVNWVNVAGSVTGLGGTILAVLLGRYADRKGPRRGLALGLGLFAVAAAGLVLVCRWPLVWLALALRGAMDGVKTLMSSTVAHETPPERLGQSLGLLSLITGAGYTLGPVLGGYAYARLPAAPFWLSAAAAGLLGLYLLQTTRVKRQDADPKLTAPPSGC